MKKIKKIMAMLLAMVMVLGMTVTAMAAPNGDIKVNAPDKAIIKYKQIIEEERTSIYGWKFSADVEDAFVKAYLDKTELEEDDANTVIASLIETGKIEKNSNNTVISSGLTTTSEAYSRALTAIREQAVNQANGGVFKPTTKGLYLITAEKSGYTFVPMAAYVSNDFTGLEVTAKGSEDQIRKSVEGAGNSVSKGDLIQYTVTVEYPYYPTEATNKKFEVTDTLTNATFEENTKDLQVTVEGGTVQYTPSVSNDKTTLTINFGTHYDPNLAGKTVTITYKATVGDVADNNSVKNSAKSTTTKGATISEVESDTVKFKVIKQDSDDDSVKLGGAEFTLYVEDENGDTTINYEGTEKKVKRIGVQTTSEEEATRGEAVFDGLDAQKTYYVKETQAPDGYSLNDTVYKLTGATVDSGTETTTTVNDITTIKKVYRATDFTDQPVNDTKLSSLPSTGGIGTTIFTIGGCAIMVAAAGLFFASRRKANK